LNSGVNDRRARGFFCSMVSMMNILPGAAPLILDVRQSGSGPPRPGEPKLSPPIRLDGHGTAQMFIPSQLFRTLCDHGVRKQWIRRIRRRPGGVDARRRWGVVLMAPAGVWLGHALTHQVVHMRVPGLTHHAHGLLSLLLVLLLGASLAALTMWRHLLQAQSRIPPIPLVVAQLLLFLGLETITHLVAGLPLGSLLTDPAVLVGLVLQALVTNALIIFAELAYRLLEVLTRARVGSRAVPALPAGTEATAPGRWSVLTTMSRRGPPRRMPSDSQPRPDQPGTNAV
jgi:hypothetical protein